MSSAPAIRCPNATLTPGAQGIVRVTVLDDTAQLIVRFANTIAAPTPLLLASSYTLSGGERIFPRILSATIYNPTGTPAALQDRRVLLQLDRIGDFSTYTLTVSDAGLDPFFA